MLYYLLHMCQGKHVYISGTITTRYFTSLHFYLWKTKHDAHDELVRYKSHESSNNIKLQELGS